MYNKNNLFQFATSELSQDAMICWICNNYNFQFDNKNLFELSEKVIKYFLGKPNLNIDRDVKIYRQFKNIDVLLIINKKYAIIIEDKTYTTEHNNQFERYKKALLELTKDEKEKLGIDKIDTITTVYLKKGFHYPYDEEVKSDLKITGKEWYDLLSDYKNCSEILDDYLIKLKEDLNYYSYIEEMYKNEEIEKVLSTHYGQYLLIEDIILDLFDDFNNFNHGTSYGRPWSNYDFYSIKYKTEEFGKCNLFFRIDKKKDYYYVSVRQYDWSHDKKELKKLEEKREMFYILRDLFKQSCENINEKIYILGGNNGNYKESEIGFFKIGNEEKSINLKEIPKRVSKFLKNFINELEKI